MAWSTAALPVVLAVSLVVGNFALKQEVPKTRNMESLQEVQHLIRQSRPVQSLPMFSLYRPNKPSGLQLRNNSACSCVGMQCGCCVHLDVKRIGLNDTGCVNVTYLSKEIGFEFTLSIDGIVLIDEKVSVSNPPPLCAGIPGLEKAASACVLFQNLTFHDKQFSGCVSVEIKFAGEVLLKYQIGCFHIPPTSNVRKNVPPKVVSMRMLPAQQRVDKQILSSPYKFHNLQAAQGLQLRNNSGCSCVGMQCGCCVHLKVETIGLNDVGCVNVTYLSKEIGFEFTLSIDGTVLIDEKVSVSNPPPLCAGIPGLEKAASACVLFQNLTFHDKQFSGCVSVEIKFAGEVLVKYQIGCFHIPPTSNVRKNVPLKVVSMRMLQAQQPVKKQLLSSPYKFHIPQAAQVLETKDNSLCACVKYDCGCCIHMQSEKISLNETGCVNVSYLPSEIGFDFKVTLNGKILIDEKVSVSNPPPFCVAVPHLHKLASVCASFHDLKFQDKQFSGCAALTVMLAGVTVETFDLGCFHIPPKHGAPLAGLIVN